MKRINPKDARLIEAEGFRDGTQKVDPAITVKEIEAQFARRQEQEDEAAPRSEALRIVRGLSSGSSRAISL